VTPDTKHCVGDQKNATPKAIATARINIDRRRAGCSSLVNPRRSHARRIDDDKQGDKSGQAESKEV
jgi:hypothetical protein